jgi:hypothetical protein
MTIDELIARERAKIDAKLTERKDARRRADRHPRGVQHREARPVRPRRPRIETAREAKAASMPTSSASRPRSPASSRRRPPTSGRRSWPRSAATGVRLPAYDGVVRVGPGEAHLQPRRPTSGAPASSSTSAGTSSASTRAPASASSGTCRRSASSGPEYLERAAGTGAFAGLTSRSTCGPVRPRRQGEPAVREHLQQARPAARGHDRQHLPITTGTSAAVQASENTAVSETNIDDTLLTINVKTVAASRRCPARRSSGAPAPRTSCSTTCSGRTPRARQQRSSTTAPSV